jgi:putative chitobiose transport system substrate-binding protein
MIAHPARQEGLPMGRMKGILWLVATLALLVGCAAQPERPARAADGRRIITFLTMALRPTFDGYFLPLIAEFEAQNPDVVINWIDSPYDEYETKLMTSFLANRSPDVINLPSESLNEYIHKGLLHQLEALLPPEVPAAFVPSILKNGGMFEGHVYALPWYASVNVLFLNRDILEQAGYSADNPPRYFTELPELCRVVRERTGKFGIFPLYTQAGSLRTMLWQAGVPILGEDGRSAGFGTPRAVEVLKFWSDLYRNNLVPREALTATHMRPIEYFKTGNLAILESGPQFIRNIRSDSPEIYEKTVVAPLLTWPGVEQNIATLHVIAVSKQSLHPETAAAFAAWVTNAENQLKFCKLVTIMPSVTAALEDSYFTDTEDTLEGNARRISAELMKRSVVFRPIPNSRMLFAVMDDMTEKTASGRIEPEQAIKQIEEKWNAILQ